MFFTSRFHAGVCGLKINHKYPRESHRATRRVLVVMTNNPSTKEGKNMTTNNTNDRTPTINDLTTISTRDDVRAVVDGPERAKVVRHLSEDLGLEAIFTDALVFIMITIAVIFEKKSPPLPVLERQDFDYIDDNTILMMVNGLDEGYTPTNKDDAIDFILSAANKRRDEVLAVNPPSSEIVELARSGEMLAVSRDTSGGMPTRGHSVEEEVHTRDTLLVISAKDLLSEAGLGDEVTQSRPVPIRHDPTPMVVSEDETLRNVEIPLGIDDKPTSEPEEDNVYFRAPTPEDPFFRVRRTPDPMPEPVPEPTPRFTFGSAKDIGLVYAEMQDDLTVVDSAGDGSSIFTFLADGCSNPPGGARAAQVAVQAAVEKMDNRGGDREIPRHMPEIILEEVHGAVKADRTAGATTFLLGLFLPQGVLLGSSGDSFIFHFRPSTGKLSVLNAMPNIVYNHWYGELSADMSEEERHKDVAEKAWIMFYKARVEGRQPQGKIDALVCVPGMRSMNSSDRAVTYRAGDVFVFCSDGLPDMLGDDFTPIFNILKSEADPQRAAELLVELANDRGGRDNISVIVVQCHADADKSHATAPLFAEPRPAPNPYFSPQGQKKVKELEQRLKREKLRFEAEKRADEIASQGANTTIMPGDDGPVDYRRGKDSTQAIDISAFQSGSAPTTSPPIVNVPPNPPAPQDSRVSQGKQQRVLKTRQMDVTEDDFAASGLNSQFKRQAAAALVAAAIVLTLLALAFMTRSPDCNTYRWSYLGGVINNGSLTAVEVDHYCVEKSAKK